MKEGIYFPHFTNVRHDRRIKRMEKELGLEGYAIYFKLFEILREQMDFRYPMDDIDLLADEIGTSHQKLRVVICNYQLFQVDDQNHFFSDNLIESMEPYLKMRQQRIEAAKSSAAQRSLNGRSTVVQRSLNECSTKEIKEKKIKENKEIKEINAENAEFEEISNIKTLGVKSDLYITIQPETLGSIKYRINGEDGLKEYFETNLSHIPRPEFTRKFLIDRNGKAYNSFKHLSNDFQVFIEKSFKR